MDMPPLAFMCNYSDRATEIVTGNSVEFMQSFEKSITRAVGAEGGFSSEKAKATVGASFRNVNSQSRKSSFNAREEGSSKQMSISAVATLYSYALREGEEPTFLSQEFKEGLAEVKDVPSAVKFIGFFGTHYLKKAEMGARFQENIYFEESATEQERKEAWEQANGNVFSVSGSGSKTGEESAKGKNDAVTVNGGANAGLESGTGE